MATAGPCGEGTITTTEENILDYSAQPKGATTIKIINNTGNTGNVLVNIKKLHGDYTVLGTSAWASIYPGESELFRLGDSEIHTCYVKSSIGTPTIRWYAVSMT